MKVRSLSLPDELDRQAEAAAERDGRTYSNWARQVFKQALARKDESGLREAQAFADSEGKGK
jgi:predicted transcriptional regulator